MMPGDANYPEQARTYDETRSASREVVGLLERFLGPGHGRSIADVAGGTGNYARAVAALGFRVVIVDRERAMLERSVAKIGSGRQVLGDATRLPLRGASVDALMCISAMHQFGDQAMAMREARRVIRDGPYVLQVFTKENLSTAFAFEYFPGSEPPVGMHPTAEEYVGMLYEVGFRRVDHSTFTYSDFSDATLHAMHTSPEALADVNMLKNTSFFQVLPEESREAGLSALRRDLESGRLAERVRVARAAARETGDGTVLAAWP